MEFDVAVRFRNQEAKTPASCQATLARVLIQPMHARNKIIGCSVKVIWSNESKNNNRKLQGSRTQESPRTSGCGLIKICYEMKICVSYQKLHIKPAQISDWK